MRGKTSKINKYQRNVFLLTGCMLVYMTRLTTSGQPQDDLAAWNEFKAKYNKQYATCEEENYRKKIFIDNKRFVESYNVKVQASFSQGINSLSDLSTDEINHSRNGFRLSLTETLPRDAIFERLVGAINDTIRVAESRRSWIGDLLFESNLDYRDLGQVSRVKDQGQCGGCWAFATTGALESRLAARNISILLSEQNLIDCSSNYGNQGCAGGLMDNALRYIKDHGIMSNRDYPYAATRKACRFNASKSVDTRNRGYIILPPNEQLLRIALALMGPIPIGIDASLKTFHMYKSGVYNDDACKSATESINHAVLLVGYGTTKFAGDYWILKNSWGKHWGENGYMRLAKNRKNLCGVASYAVLPIP